jgi:hypothetical protein
MEAQMKYLRSIVLIIGIVFSTVVSAPVSITKIYADFTSLNIDASFLGDKFDVTRTVPHSYILTHGNNNSYKYYTMDGEGFIVSNSDPGTLAVASLSKSGYSASAFTNPVTGSSSASTASWFDLFFNVDDLKSLTVSMDIEACLNLTTDNPGDYASGSTWGQLRLYIWPENQGPGPGTYTFLDADLIRDYASVENGDDYSFSAQRPLTVSWDFGDQPFSGQLRADFYFDTEAQGTAEAASVPEPGQGSLIIIGLCMLFLIRKLFLNRVTVPLHNNTYICLPIKKL